MDGRTPLHWAAYKGHANTLRLLIVLEAQLALGDREGCTPLHWAAIRGNSEACTVLLQVPAGETACFGTCGQAANQETCAFPGQAIAACLARSLTIPDREHGRLRMGIGRAHCWEQVR